MENNLAFIKGRILYVAKVKGIRLADFCESIGQTYGNYKGENIKSAVSSDVLAKLLSLYPDVNADFILRGVGEVLISSQQGASHSLSISGDRNDSPSVHIAGGTNAVAHGGSTITYNNGYTEAGGDSSIDSSTVIALLQKIIETQNEQLAKKDEQIDGLIKAIQR